MDNQAKSVETWNVESHRWRHVLRRIGAYIIDLVLVFMVYVFVQSLLFPFVARRYEAVMIQNGWLLELYVLGTISLPIWLYFILSERSRWQATVGKRLFGIRVTAVLAARLTARQIIIRTVGKLLPWEIAHFAVNVPTNPWMNPNTVFSAWRLMLIGFVYLLLIVYIISVIKRPQQTVYDRLAQTAVIPATLRGRLQDAEK